MRWKKSLFLLIKKITHFRAEAVTVCDLDILFIAWKRTKVLDIVCFRSHLNQIFVHVFLITLHVCPFGLYVWPCALRTPASTSALCLCSSTFACRANSSTLFFLESDSTYTCHKRFKILSCSHQNYSLHVVW